MVLLFGGTFMGQYSLIDSGVACVEGVILQTLPAIVGGGAAFKLKPNTDV